MDVGYCVITNTARLQPAELHSQRPWTAAMPGLKTRNKQSFFHQLIAAVSKAESLCSNGSFRLPVYSLATESLFWLISLN